MSYYSNVNMDLFNAVPRVAKRILEVGCGEGWFGKKVKEELPSCTYHGVELFDAAAQIAKSNIDCVLVGNIEEPPLLSDLEGDYDLFIFGDLLEHLVDPWRTLSLLREKAAPNSTCIACIPNVSHWSIISGLLRGQWNYADSGLLDRTHLRFFTVETMFQLFQSAGWSAKLEAKPRILWPDRTSTHLDALLPAARQLGIPDQTFITNCRAFQWIVKAESG